jgi:hypothetical protein
MSAVGSDSEGRIGPEFDAALICELVRSSPTAVSVLSAGGVANISDDVIPISGHADNIRVSVADEVGRRTRIPAS